jgi:hypothetical protein
LGHRARRQGVDPTVIHEVSTRRRIPARVSVFQQAGDLPLPPASEVLGIVSVWMLYIYIKVTTIRASRARFGPGSSLLTMVLDPPLRRGNGRFGRRRPIRSNHVSAATWSPGPALGRSDNPTKVPIGWRETRRSSTGLAEA